MSLTPENGSGVPNADTYATTADFQQFCTDYDYTVPPTGAQEGYLRRAALAMNSMRWVGSRTTTIQSLAWPRAKAWPKFDAQTDPIPSNAIPREIFLGQMQYALELYNQDVNPAIAPGAVGPISEKSEAVAGAVSRTIRYDNSGRILPASPFAKSNTLFSAFLVSSGLVGIVSRA